MALRIGRAAAIVAVLVVACGSALSGAGAQFERPAGWQFGVIGGSEHDTDIAELGVGWQQITFEWAAIQPYGPDDDVAGAVDAEIFRAAHAAGREIVGHIIATPAWASTSGHAAAIPDGLNLPVNDPDNVWAAFVSHLVREYTPRGIRHWVIYDEPDVRLGEGPLQFGGDVDAYARLLEVAYQAARQTDPRARIHVAAMNWWTDVAAGREPYLARLVPALLSDPEAEGAPFFDAVVVRATNSTAGVWTMLAGVRQILDAAGLTEKDIWLEVNASPTLDRVDPLGNPVFGITPSMQADFLVQAAALGLAAGAERVGVLRWVDDDASDQLWGLVREDGSRRPAFAAYQTAIEWFGSAQVAQRYENLFVELVVLERAGQSVYVLWSRGTQPAEFIITSGAVGEQARMVAPDSRSRPIISEALEWPAAFRLAVPAAARDSNGFLTVAGSPSIAVFDAVDDFFRVVYVVVNGERYRLK